MREGGIIDTTKMHRIFSILLLHALAPHALAGGKLDAPLRPAQQALAAGDYKNGALGDAGILAARPRPEGRRALGEKRNERSSKQTVALN